MSSAGKELASWSSFLSGYIGSRSSPDGAADGSLVVTPARIVSFVQGPAGEIAALMVERNGRRREVAVRSEPLRGHLEAVDLSRPGAAIVARGSELLGVLWTVARPGVANVPSSRRAEYEIDENTEEAEPDTDSEPSGWDGDADADEEGGSGDDGEDSDGDGGEDEEGESHDDDEDSDGDGGEDEEGGSDPDEGDLNAGSDTDGEGRPRGTRSGSIGRSGSSKEETSGTGSQPGSSHGSRAPKITARGQAAWVAANKVLATAEPIEVPAPPLGKITLRPGATFGNRMLVYAGPLQVYYLEGSDLWEAYTPDFVRDLWLSSLSKGVASAAWIIPLAKAEFAFITAFFVPWWGVMLMSGAQAYAFYRDHKAAIHLAYDAAKRARELWSAFQQRYPTLARKTLEWGFRQTLSSAPGGVELEDIAYFIGRVVGTQGVLGKVQRGIDVTLKVVLKVVIEYALLVGLLHSPQIVGRGLEKEATKHAEQLMRRLRERGFQVVLNDARAMLVEIGSQPDSDQIMDEFKRACQDMADKLGDLVKAYKEEMP